MRAFGVNIAILFLDSHILKLFIPKYWPTVSIVKTI
jgi:hypothetical protein